MFVTSYEADYGAREMDERVRAIAGDQLLIFSFDDHLTKYLWWQNNVRNSFMNVIVSAANDQFLVGYVCGAVVRLLTAPGWLELKSTK